MEGLHYALQRKRARLAADAPDALRDFDAKWGPWLKQAQAEEVAAPLPPLPVEAPPSAAASSGSAGISRRAGGSGVAAVGGAAAAGEPTA